VPDVVRVNDAEAKLRAAQLNEKNAKSEFERFSQLKEVVSESEFAAKKLSYELRQQELRAAHSHLQLVRKGVASDSSAAANEVRATIDGMVLNVPAKEGASVIESNAFNAGTTIATLADMTDMVFIGWLDEGDVGKVQEGMALDIKVGALGENKLSGSLEHIAPKASNNDGAIQFEIRAAVTVKGEVFLRAGYSANASIVLESRTQVLTLNERVLQFDDGKAFVEVPIGDDQSEKRYLELGLSDGIHIEVKDGLTEGAEVIVPADIG
jgi:HlyD family secretion protein